MALEAAQGLAILISRKPAHVDDFQEVTPTGRVSPLSIYCPSNGMEQVTCGPQFLKNHLPLWE